VAQNGLTRKALFLPSSIEQITSTILIFKAKSDIFYAVALQSHEYDRDEHFLALSYRALNV
jgi:hypothetical protein